MDVTASKSKKSQRLSFKADLEVIAQFAISFPDSAFTVRQVCEWLTTSLPQYEAKQTRLRKALMNDSKNITPIFKRSKPDSFPIHWTVRPELQDQLLQCFTGRPVTTSPLDPCLLCGEKWNHYQGLNGMGGQMNEQDEKASPYSESSPASIIPNDPESSTNPRKVSFEQNVNFGMSFTYATAVTSSGLIDIGRVFIDPEFASNLVPESLVAQLGIEPYRAHSFSISFADQVRHGSRHCTLTFMVAGIQQTINAGVVEIPSLLLGKGWIEAANLFATDRLLFIQDSHGNWKQLLSQPQHPVEDVTLLQEAPTMKPCTETALTEEEVAFAKLFEPERRQQFGTLRLPENPGPLTFSEYSLEVDLISPSTDTESGAGSSRNAATPYELMQAVANGSGYFGDSEWDVLSDIGSPLDDASGGVLVSGVDMLYEADDIDGRADLDEYDLETPNQPRLQSRDAAVTTALTEGQEHRITQALTNLLGSAVGEYFTAPVEQLWPEYAASYNAKIQAPMDLGTMLIKARDRDYCCVCKFQAEVELLYKNCVEFNGSENEITKAAWEVRSILLAAIAGSGSD